MLGASVAHRRRGAAPSAPRTDSASPTFAAADAPADQAPWRRHADTDARPDTGPRAVTDTCAHPVANPHACAHREAAFPAFGHAKPGAVGHPNCAAVGEPHAQGAGRDADCDAEAAVTAGRDTRCAAIAVGFS